MALSIFTLALGLTMSAFLAATKRAVHTERVASGTTALRHAADLISEAVRSSPQTPLLLSGGTQLLLAPRDLGYATVLATTWIDTLHNVKGSKANQRMLHISNVIPAAVTASVYRSAARPGGAVAAYDVATYFTDGSALRTIDLNDLFASGDTLAIPATPYGPATTGVINNISNNSGNKTLTLTDNLGVDVPNGTRIAATSGRRILFSVESNGDLRYYPDRRNMARFVVLARAIDPAPYSVPSDTGSPRMAPFTLSGRNVGINLQYLPAGSMAGRTVQGLQTVAFTRTDPLLP